METWLIWVVIGFALVIAELLTGTFYLLVLGVGFFAAALCAWLGANFLIQAVVGSGVALVGAWLVHHWHSRNQLSDGGRSNLLDRGQPVVLERWTNQPAGIGRVKYRGASWDARLADAQARPEEGATLYIEGQEGSTLIVGAAPPAR